MDKAGLVETSLPAAPAGLENSHTSGLCSELSLSSHSPGLGSQKAVPGMARDGTFLLGSSWLHWGGGTGLHQGHMHLLSLPALASDVAICLEPWGRAGLGVEGASSWAENRGQLSPAHVFSSRGWVFACQGSASQSSKGG